MTREQKLTIFEKIQELGEIWGKADCVEMLDHIWSLHRLASEDPRYSDAYGDAVQHLRNNDDWDAEYTFITRFGLLNADDEVFCKFLNAVVSVDTRNSEEEIEQYVEAINPLIESAGMCFVKKGEDYGLPIYEVNKKGVENDEWPLDITKNQILFYVDSQPTTFPSFSLSSESWDDYGRKSLFRLSFVKSEHEQKIEIGEVKIMHSEVLNSRSMMPASFDVLSGAFCSVGQNESYYHRLKDYFADDYKSILFALRDAAYYSKIADRFQYTISFQKSLLRYTDAQRAFRNARAILENIDKNDRYNFTILTSIPPTEEKVHVDFHFGDLDSTDNLDRIKALIGENGSGKSTILLSLAKGLHDENVEMFENLHKPDFSKVIAISYSIFDKMHKLAMQSSYNLVYCGLRSRENDLLSEEDKQKRLQQSLDEITYKERVSDYYKTLTEILDRKVLQNIFPSHHEIDKAKMLEAMKQMSSGQSMLTSIITEIYAHIRDNALILFDEPEVHLHANAITRLMRILFDVCQKFKSACIVATHSAVVLQELLARNVIVVERDADTDDTSVRKMNRETLGENLTSITEDVFGRASIDKHYGKVIQFLVEKGKSEEDIESVLKTEGLPMSLNLYMYMRRQLEIRDK